MNKDTSKPIKFKTIQKNTKLGEFSENAEILEDKADWFYNYYLVVNLRKL